MKLLQTGSRPRLPTPATSLSCLPTRRRLICPAVPFGTWRGGLGVQRRKIGTRRRRLPVGPQALLTLAHLQYDDTYAQLAAGFRIGTATAYHYMREAVDVLAALAPTLARRSRPYGRRHS